MKESIKKGISFMKEKKDDYLDDRYNEIEILKQRCDEESSTLRKLYLIRDSKIMPYNQYATAILQDVAIPLSIKKEAINKLTNKELLNSKDFDELMAKVQADFEVRTVIKESNKEKCKEKTKKFLDSLSGDGLVHCPKCGSTSIITTNKKFSATRYIAFGPAGAFSSKKMYNVCQKCGHRWKI